MGYSATAPLEAMFDAAPLERSCRRIAERSLELLHSEVKRRTPVGKLPPGVTAKMVGRVPGTLKESWQTSGVDVGVSPGGTARFSGEEYTLDPIGPHVEWPTRPHVIRPRLDREPASVVATRRPRRSGHDPMARLRFVSMGGRVVYAREVHHPGTQGTHMMRDALAEVDASWEARVGQGEVERWAREQAKLVWS